MANTCSTFCNGLRSAGKDIGIIAAMTCLGLAAGVVGGIVGAGKVHGNRNLAVKNGCYDIPDEAKQSDCIDAAEAENKEAITEFIIAFSLGGAFLGAIIGFTLVLHRHKVACFKGSESGNRASLIGNAA